VGLVDLQTFEVGGDATLADALADRAAFGLQLAAGVVAVEGGAVRVGEADDHVGILLAPGHGDARQRAAGPHRADKAVHLAPRLAPDLGAGALDVGLAVGDVVELVGPDRAGRLLRGQLLGQTPRVADVVVGVGVGDRVHLDQLGAVEPDRVLLLLALGPGHHDGALVAQRLGDHGQADAGVARGALDDPPAGLQEPLPLRIADDVE